MRKIIPVKIGMLIESLDSVKFTEVLKANPEIDRFYAFSQTEDVLHYLGNGSVNAILIDIFTFGIDFSLKLIDKVRKEFPSVPIAIIGTRQQLSDFPDVPSKWKQRFSHYYKVPKDIDQQFLRIGLEELIIRMEGYLYDNQASEDLKEVRNVLIKNLENENQALIDEISSKLENAEKALEGRQRPVEIVNLIQGFQSEDIKKLVTDTLEKASLSLEETARINKWVLICGLLLVISSFVVASVTEMGNYGIWRLWYCRYYSVINHKSY